MIKRGTLLDTGNPTQLRIKKMDQVCTSTIHLLKLFEAYIQGLESLASVENKIGVELQILYSQETIYADLIKRVASFISYRSEITSKSASLLKQEMIKAKSIEKNFTHLTPFVKSYLKNFEKIDHYTKKVARISLDSDAEKVKKGFASPKTLKRLMRNQKKLEEAKTTSYISSNNIIEQTNKLNLERFDKFNPLISQFITFELVISNIPEIYSNNISGFKDTLEIKMDSRFNDLFFINTPNQTASANANRYSAAQLDSTRTKQPSTYTYKQNVQNNYYILNDEQRSQMKVNQAQSDQNFNPNVPISEFLNRGDSTSRRINPSSHTLAIDNGKRSHNDHQIVKFVKKEDHYFDVNSN